MAGVVEDLLAHMLATTTITGATSNRIHAYHVPETSITPRVLVMRSGKDTPLTLDGASGLVRTDFAIELATTAPAACETLMDAIHARLHGYRGTMNSNTVVRGMFVADVDNDYQFSSVFDDAGLCLAAKQVIVWHTS